MPHGMTREKLEQIGAKWLQRLAAAEKREKEWRKDAEAAERAYTNDEKLDGKSYDFNVLHANVETIVPAIYNSTPVPDIRRRFQDEDPVGKQVADVLERAISAQVDDNRLDKEMEAGAQSAFLAGRAILRVRFDADWEDESQVEETGLDEAMEEEGADPEAPEIAEAEALPRLRPGTERILCEAVSWRDFRMGPAKRWEDVSWIAFLHHLPEEEVERLTDTDLLDLQRGPDETTLGDADEEDIQVWEIWCKQTRRVMFIRDNDRKVLRIEDDPLELQDFFPIAFPVQPITLTGQLVPVCPFSIYRRLADELDLITKRIIKITSVMKLKGLTYGDAGDLVELSQAADGEIIPARNLEQLAQTKGLDGAISWWPIEPAAKALAQLYLNRDQTRQAIYEITGISDIIRGASEAQETATAQQIKTQWGSLRIQKMQRLLQRQVRDVFVMMAEIISRHFSAETLAMMTGVQLDGQAEALLRDQVRQRYRIDVETDSTIRADLTRMRGEMSQFLEGTGQFFGAVAPVVEQRPELQEPLAEVYAAFARNFSLGKSAEDALERMAQGAKEAPPEQGPSLEDQKAQVDMKKLELEAQKAQMDMQSKQADLELKKAEEAFDQQVERDKLNIERIRLAQEADFRREELDLKRAEMGMKAESEREAREAGTKRETAKSNEKAGLPADFSMQSIVDHMNATREQQRERDAEQSKAINANAEAIRALAESLGAPKEAILSDGRRIRVESRKAS